MNEEKLVNYLMREFQFKKSDIDNFLGNIGFTFNLLNDWVFFLQSHNLINISFSNIVDDFVNKTIENKIMEINSLFNQNEKYSELLKKLLIANNLKFNTMSGEEKKILIDNIVETAFIELRKREKNHN